MTAYQLYENALHLISEAPDTAGYSDEQAISIINMVLFETFRINNSIRIFNALEKLTEPQQITALTDELTYVDELLISVLPYGLASKFLMADNEVDKGQLYQELYANTLNDSAKTNIVVVTL